MKNRNNLKKYILFLSVLLLIFAILILIINNIQYKNYRYKYNSTISNFVGVIKNEYPNVLEEDLVKILISYDDVDNNLIGYGLDINKDNFVDINDDIYYRYVIIYIIMFLLLLVLFIFIYIKYDNYYLHEIDNLISLLEKINRKNYELDFNNISEDKISILKEEIYKTTIMLKESAYNSLNDKLNLKESLQDISHQLKTPLTSISILLDNLIDDPSMDVEIRDKFIKEIKREIKNINFLVQNILKLSKFESNTVIFNKSEVDLNNMLSTVIKNLSNLCDLKNININLLVKCEKKIFCDFKWQVEAISNIVKNAIEHSNSNSNIDIICDENKIYCEIKIINYGKCIDKKDINNIFKRFYNSNSCKSDSYGIGLALSKQIIEKDNGLIYVDSNNDRTSFIIKYFY